MAKKSASGKSFNMAAEIRAQLKQNKDATGPEVIRALQKKFPGQSINENSCLAAVSGARRELGIARRRRTVRKKKPSARRGGGSGGGGALDMSTLQAARRYVSQVGSVDEAIAAVQTIKTLQVD